MPNCVKTEAQKTVTMTETSKECSSILNIHPVPVMMNPDNSNGMDQQIYSHAMHAANHFQQPVTEWAPLLHAVPMTNAPGGQHHQQQSNSL